MVASTLILPTVAVLAGALCLLFFALFTGYYFRNRRQALALRDRGAADAQGGGDAAVRAEPDMAASRAPDAPVSPGPDARDSKERR